MRNGQFNGWLWLLVSVLYSRPNVGFWIWLLLQLPGEVPQSSLMLLWGWGHNHPQGNVLEGHPHGKILACFYISFWPASDMYLNYTYFTVFEEDSVFDFLLILPFYSTWVAYQAVFFLCTYLCCFIETLYTVHAYKWQSCWNMGFLSPTVSGFQFLCNMFTASWWNEMMEMFYEQIGQTFTLFS